MAYQVYTKAGPSAFGVIVETAEDALTKMAEMIERGYAEVIVRDMLGKIIDPKLLVSDAGH